MLAALDGLNLPESVIETAQQSLGAGLAVAEQLPTEVALTVSDAARQAFVDGLSAGSLVAGAVALLGAIVALVLLPARHATPASDTTPALVDAE